MRENKQDLTKRRDDIAVADMVVNMADKVTDKVANMVVNMADSKKINGRHGGRQGGQHGGRQKIILTSTSTWKFNLVRELVAGVG